jgi:hypothetical protein
VSPDAECFSAELSNDLSDLLRVYDGRQRFPSVTATGTVFEPPSTAGNEGIIFLPTYNTNHLPWKAFSKLMRRVGVSLVLPTSTDQNAALNFLWIPFNMLTFYESHRPFSDAFEELHGVKLVSVLSVITALAVRAFSEWQADPARFVRDWQRAYDGPMMPSLCIDKIRDVLPAALRVVSLDTTADQVEVEKVVDYLSWKESKRSSIDLVVPGPHSFFLPYGDSRCFVDYAWILQRLYRLFLDVKLSDQNFKGAAFEELVRRNGSVLPVKPCKAHDGTTKQVDCAMDLGDALLVVECKVKAQSIGWERGASAAIEGRQQFIEEAIGDADEKAFWLAQRPRGANYDVSKYKRILAVVVTPFVEFIWTKSSYYWLSTALPRVLTPTELDTALSDESLSSIALTHQMSAPVMHRQA